MAIQARNPFENDDPFRRRNESDSGEDIDHTFADPLEGLVVGVEHVGLAVHDLDVALDGYRAGLGVTVEHREVLVDEGMEVARLHVGVGATHLHLLAPAGEDSGVAEFLAEWGPGLHHVGYVVSDLPQALEVLAEAGAELIDHEPAQGFSGMIVAWVDATDLLGSLVLLIQSP